MSHTSQDVSRRRSSRMLDWLRPHHTSTNTRSTNGGSAHNGEHAPSREHTRNEERVSNKLDNQNEATNRSFSLAEEAPPSYESAITSSQAPPFRSTDLNTEPLIRTLPPSADDDVSPPPYVEDPADHPRLVGINDFTVATHLQGLNLSANSVSFMSRSGANGTSTQNVTFSGRNNGGLQIASISGGVFNMSSTRTEGGGTTFTHTFSGVRVNGVEIDGSISGRVEAGGVRHNASSNSRSIRQSPRPTYVRRSARSSAEWGDATDATDSDSSESSESDRWYGRRNRRI